MTAETAKFIRTCRTLHEYAPEKSLDDVFAKAQELLGITSRERERKSRPRATTKDKDTLVGVA